MTPFGQALDDLFLLVVCWDTWLIDEFINAWLVASSLPPLVCWLLHPSTPVSLSLDRFVLAPRTRKLLEDPRAKESADDVWSKTGKRGARDNFHFGRHRHTMWSSSCGMGEVVPTQRPFYLRSESSGSASKKSHRIGPTPESGLRTATASHGCCLSPWSCSHSLSLGRHPDPRCTGPVIQKQTSL